jgi:hypothetical protein
VVKALNFVCDVPVDRDGISCDTKLAFFNETRHAYGRTALLLSGGAGKYMKNSFQYLNMFVSPWTHVNIHSRSSFRVCTISTPQYRIFTYSFERDRTLMDSCSPHLCFCISLTDMAGLGFYHVGFVKALFEQGILPRVLSGASAGSIISSMIGVRQHTSYIVEIG